MQTADGRTGFGLHLVNLTARSTEGGVALPDVEAAFAKRLGDMTAFDAFMDHHVSLWAPRRGVPAASECHAAT